MSDASTRRATLYGALAVVVAAVITAGVTFASGGFASGDRVRTLERQVDVLQAQLAGLEKGLPVPSTTTTTSSRPSSSTTKAP